MKPLDYYRYCGQRSKEANRGLGSDMRRCFSQGREGESGLFCILSMHGKKKGGFGGSKRDSQGEEEEERDS